MVKMIQNSASNQNNYAFPKDVMKKLSRAYLFISRQNFDYEVDY